MLKYHDLHEEAKKYMNDVYFINIIRDSYHNTNDSISFFKYHDLMGLYGTNTKLVRKKWYGAVDFYGDEQLTVSLDSDSNDPKLQDTSLAIFKYNKRGLKDSVYVYNDNKNKKLPNYYVLYKHDERDSLTAVEEYHINRGISLSMAMKGLRADTSYTVKVTDIKYKNGVKSEKTKYTGFRTKQIINYDSNIKAQ